MLHAFNHGLSLAVGQVLSLLQADAMLCTYRSSGLTHKVKDESVHCLRKSVLQVSIVIAWDAYIQVNVAISNVPVTSVINAFFL